MLKATLLVVVGWFGFGCQGAPRSAVTARSPARVCPRCRPAPRQPARPAVNWWKGLKPILAVRYPKKALAPPRPGSAVRVSLDGWVPKRKIFDYEGDDVEGTLPAPQREWIRLTVCLVAPERPLTTKTIRRQYRQSSGPAKLLLGLRLAAGQWRGAVARIVKIQRAEARKDTAATKRLRHQRQLYLGRARWWLERVLKAPQPPLEAYCFAQFLLTKKGDRLYRLGTPRRFLKRAPAGHRLTEGMLVALAREAFDQRKFAEARKAYARLAATKAPVAVYARYKLGWISFLEGKPADARRSWRAAHRAALGARHKALRRALEGNLLLLLAGTLGPADPVAGVKAVLDTDAQDAPTLLRALQRFGAIVPRDRALRPRAEHSDITVGRPAGFRPRLAG